METETCSMCKIEEHIGDFYKKYTECKNSICKKCLKRFNDIEEKISNQRKLC